MIIEKKNSTKFNDSDKIEMALELGVNIDHLEKLIGSEKRRNNRMRKINSEKKEYVTSKLKYFYSNISQYPDTVQIYKLSKDLDKSEKKIKEWFKRERYRNNRVSKIQNLIILNSSK